MKLATQKRLNAEYKKRREEAARAQMEESTTSEEEIPMHKRTYKFKETVAEKIQTEEKRAVTQAFDQTLVMNRMQQMQA